MQLSACTFVTCNVFCLHFQLYNSINLSNVLTFFEPIIISILCCHLHSHRTLLHACKYMHIALIMFVPFPSIQIEQPHGTSTAFIRHRSHRRMQTFSIYTIFVCYRHFFPCFFVLSMRNALHFRFVQNLKPFFSSTSLLCYFHMILHCFGAKI